MSDISEKQLNRPLRLRRKGREDFYSNRVVPLKRDSRYEQIAHACGRLGWDPLAKIPELNKALCLAIARA